MRRYWSPVLAAGIGPGIGRPVLVGRYWSAGIGRPVLKIVRCAFGSAGRRRTYCMLQPVAGALDMNITEGSS